MLEKQLQILAKHMELTRIDPHKKHQAGLVIWGKRKGGRNEAILDVLQNGSEDHFPFQYRK